MVKLEDLMEMDGLYYIGDIMDNDGQEWVDKKTAIKILEIVNTEDEK